MAKVKKYIFCVFSQFSWSRDNNVYDDKKKLYVCVCVCVYTEKLNLSQIELRKKLLFCCYT